MQPGGNQQRPGPDVPRWALAIVFVVGLSFVGPWFFIRAVAEPHSLHTAAFIPDPAPPMGNRSLTTGNSLLLPVAPKAASLPDGHSPTATASATPSATPTATSSPTATPTSTPTATSTATPTATSTGPVAGWWDSRWRARLKIEVGGGGYARSNAVAEASLDFTQKLQEAGLTGALDDSHLRVVETDASGALLDEEVPFQFDRDQNYEAGSRATGQLIFLAQGDTGASQMRHFYVYYDTHDNAAGKTEAVVTPRVRYEGAEVYEGQNSYKIISDNAAHYYHRYGGGFASLIDSQGIDWISYHPAGGAAGNYRGIPNVATIDGDGALLGLFHPGYTSGSSDLLSQGPIKITITSQADGDVWRVRWEIYPHYARMTLYEKPSDRPYWFLYEGTPGGSISSGDYYVLPDGVQQDLYTPFSADLPGEEWIYYGDDEADQVLYLVNALPDDAEDCHYIMQDFMTIFGFGRARNQSGSPMLQAEPGIFLVGFLDAGPHAAIQAQIQAAYKPLTISVGSGQSP